MATYLVSAEDSGTDTANSIPRRYAWVVFALTFGLLISDYMSRQVLNAVFPLLKSEWALSDSQLGLLSGIVALMVGLLTFPLSLLADRFGRVRSLVLMAVLWSLATLGCALAENYSQMFIARFLVGVGEAAYGSVGIAVVVAVFPRDMRSTLAGAFMAGGMFGSVLGMALGGVLAQHLGWRWAFAGMALFGLVLAMLYPVIVKERRIAPKCAQQALDKASHPLRTLYSSRSVIAAYVGSGLQLFVGGTLIVWMPSYLNRYYAMGTDRAGAIAAVIVLCSGIGMILCAMLCDRLGRQRPDRKISLAIGYCLGSCALLSIAFALPAGTAQLVLICLGMMIAAGTNGPSSAMVANLTHAAVHGTAFATLTLANNLLGLATGPLITGRVSDLIGLQAALQWVPLTSIAAAAVFLVAKRHYHRDMDRLRARS
ncbi:multidrug DMT transporter permease [Pseudomonas putida JB]|jgi:MFS family permease|uniref:MFS transporter n=1 Tax=Pseudomonas TaxID=286 RepID=UPI0001F31A7C|nr:MULTISPECIES: MFS transporter [Pseudomonas]ADR60293.1 Major facilitator transporter [Pseudomonas putida BIRD-1]AOX09251.1 multidrug DMT transporter permease [Pseudomonas putida JB]MCI1025328.1 MFS transporter [Pseudomonas putida]MDN4513051.1 MFS transporter [Pseudomonas sp. 2,4-D]PWY39569.1 MFS transporter [Pseudomonas sp. RW405]